MNTLLAQLSPAQLRRAANLKEQIARLEKELGNILGSSTSPAPPKGRKTMSASAKARISQFQKARWAKIKGKAKPKRKMSAAAKARLSAKLKAIWKARKAGKK